jgi:mRNA-degrading endonuclease RelE of RelBE toxin-antitoxin system
LEGTTIYTVEITPKAEGFYYDVLEYFYEHCSEESANKKSDELLELAIKLENNPSRGRKEDKLKSLGRNHRFVLYYYTPGNAIKIIYYIDEARKTVFVTDFFPCESDEKKISKRS